MLIGQLTKPQELPHARGRLQRHCNDKCNLRSSSRVRHSRLSGTNFGLIWPFVFKWLGAFQSHCFLMHQQILRPTALILRLAISLSWFGILSRQYFNEMSKISTKITNRKSKAPIRSSSQALWHPWQGQLVAEHETIGGCVAKSEEKCGKLWPSVFSPMETKALGINSHSRLRVELGHGFDS